ncbi:hypothetical protein CAPTEDRAFT_220611 [Capitella teleta]|uniref:HEXIM P-TEFb complex subunit 1 n=1 Tax=Capitella teleta TaxID=283909 RepID=R7U396_CAPTE|nr:hypothetical protein CAPTEDRAFT_220611 [Capitella teleta]|eukprot:ELU00419.1 hypothetical protein CAPTEDRAFT_220611 [Capitella teleta]
MAAIGGSTDGVSMAAEESEGPAQEVRDLEGPSQNGESCSSDKEKGDDSSKWKRNRRKGKGGKHRRGYKPYCKMTWDEKKTQEERETKRAFKKREKRFASGQPMAPYNTTQFLMDQHDSMDSTHLEDPKEASFDSSDDFHDSNEDDTFLHKDFDEAYDNYHAERLHAMSKGELIAEHLALESKIEDAEKDLKSLKSGNNNSDSELQAEIQRLTEENSWLRRENGILKGIKTGEATEC